MSRSQQFANEPVRAGDQFRAAVEHAVHVDQEAEAGRWSQEHETSFVALWWSGRGLARVREGVVASKWRDGHTQRVQTTCRWAPRHGSLSEPTTNVVVSEDVKMNGEDDECLRSGQMTVALRLREGEGKETPSPVERVATVIHFTSLAISAETVSMSLSVSLPLAKVWFALTTRSL